MSHPVLRAVAFAAALLPALAPAAPLSFDRALELAVQRSAAIRAARAGASSATEASRFAGELPDPMLAIGVDNLPVDGADRFSTARDSMTMKRVGIAQEWISADKRAARQAASQAMADREAALAHVAEADVRLQTALAFIDAYYARLTLQLTTLTEHHAHEELEAARGRLASAAGSAQEVLALTGSRGVAEDESAEVRQAQDTAQAVLQRWVGVPAAELSEPPTHPVVQEQTFVFHHPTVVTARRQAEAARQEALVAATDRRPNWTWEISYGQRAGHSDVVSLGVSIPLPVAPARRQDRQTASKLALAEQAQGHLDEATRAATAEYRALAGDSQRLVERIERYRAAVVTPARQRTAAALAGYRSNQTSLIELFEARHAQVDAQRKLLSLRKELARTSARLSFRPVAQGGPR